MEPRHPRRADSLHTLTAFLTKPTPRGALQVRVDVSASAPGKARALLSHSRQPLPFPLPLEPLVAKPTFFEKREGFNWSGMLMNPMVIMMGITVLIWSSSRT